MDAEPLDLDRRARFRPEPDREDPHSSLSRGLGGHERIRLLVVLAIGQQDDRRRRVRAGADDRRQRVGIRRAIRVVAGLRVSLGRGDRGQGGHDPASDRCAALGPEPIDGCKDRRLVVGRDEHREARVAERHDPDQDRLRLARNELPRRGLRRLHPGRVHVSRGHAAGHIERQDHRSLEARDTDDALRPRHRRTPGRRGRPPTKPPGPGDGPLRQPRPYHPFRP